MDAKGNGKALMTLPVITGAEMDLMTLGSVFAKSGFFSDSREAAQAITKIIAGRELGIPAIAAMTGIYIVKGRITLGANLIAALVKRSGRYAYRVRKLDNDGCAIAFLENGEELGVSTFTREDAAAAGLTGGENWKHFPRNMLFARAMSNGAKWYCPDLFGGPIYTPAELGAAMDPESGGPLVDITTGEVIEAESALPAPAKRNGREVAEAKVRALEDELRGLGVEIIDVDLASLANGALTERGKALKQLRIELDAAGWPAIAERAVAMGAEPIAENVGSRELMQFVNNWRGLVEQAEKAGAEPELSPDEIPF